MIYESVVGIKQFWWHGVVSEWVKYRSLKSWAYVIKRDDVIEWEAYSDFSFFHVEKTSIGVESGWLKYTILLKVSESEVENWSIQTLKSRNRQSGVACWSIKLDINSWSKNFVKSSESEIRVWSQRSASVLKSVNEVIAGLTYFDHFWMNCSWDFLIKRWFYETLFHFRCCSAYAA